VVTEVGFKVATDPDTVRAPNVAVIHLHRIPSPVPRGFWKGPCLAMEVLNFKPGLITARDSRR
jgi:hypothetical protein